ncbi:MAG TPA: hypothetical protein GX398_00395 [Candidatus Cloacimonetes bacterium]|jgi:endonuclease/exonuclease/phosphatase family metal-dependent hydrolase|nr:hypothetical protein [Candidatus Cloacimonas sp.]HHZ14562.1 hypothetical protein [Candidatus Cloacimonadota bacterium]
MKNYLNIFAVILVVIFGSSCGSNTKLVDPIEVSPIEFGMDNTFEVLTWNLRDFPLKNVQTLQELAAIIPQLKVDVLAFQEIQDTNAFYELARMLPDYEAYVSTATSLYRLAYLYNTRYVSVNDVYPIYTGQTNPFPRPPYVLDINWRDQNIILVNNHLKAYGDNYIDEDDPWDEERRRRLACEKLDYYISTNWDDKAVVVLGDMNDQIAEPEEYNVFMVFISQPDKYQFTDMHIAQNPSYTNVSYPTMLSHIDHILITDELFESYSLPNSKCETIRVEDVMGTWQNYYNLISDHRPVALRLQFTP